MDQQSCVRRGSSLLALLLLVDVCPRDSRCCGARVCRGSRRSVDTVRVCPLCCRANDAGPMRAHVLDFVPISSYNRCEKKKEPIPSFLLQMGLQCYEDTAVLDS
jgi:hypothetical protein